MILIAVGFTTFLVVSLISDDRKKDVQIPYRNIGKNADVSISHLSFVQTEEGGRTVTLDANHMDFYTDNQNALLNTVSVSIPYGEGLELQLQGDEGTIDSEKEDFSLWKKSDPMVIKLESGLTVKTNSLTWHNKKRTIVSKGPVQILGKQIEINGQKLHFLIDNEEMTVSGNVRTLVY